MSVDDVGGFGDAVAELLDGVPDGALVGVYFVGSVALGGYVPGESDLDIAAVCEVALTRQEKLRVASARR